VKISGYQIASFLKNPNPKVLGILLFGPEHGLIKERSKTLARTVVEDLSDPFRINSITCSELKANPPLLCDQAAQLTMTGGKRVIFVLEANDSVSNIFKDYLNKSTNQTLVIAESGSLNPRSSLRKLFEKSEKGAAISCYEDDKNTLRAVIKETLGRFDLSISGDALTYLENNLGSNRILTRGELEKLATYVNNQYDKNMTVSLNDAMACVGDSTTISLDLVVYAVTGGDLNALEKLILKAFSDGNQPVRILRAVQRHLQNLHFVTGRIETGLPLERALALIRPPINFKYKKQFQSQVSQWQKTNIIKALDLIIEAEIDCKSSGFPANAGCHRTLMRIAQTARIQK
jgi:DNA polymerase-3 subunit delta